MDNYYSFKYGEYPIDQYYLQIKRNTQETVIYNLLMIKNIQEENEFTS